MNSMSPRQSQILSAIIELYADSAEPVSSQLLVEQFDCSSATIRAEMSELERLGLIYQPHISAGRVPTDKGYRAYVNGMKDSQGFGLTAPSRTAYAIERRIRDSQEVDWAIKQAAESLAEATHNVGLATLSNNVFFTGMARLFNKPEFVSPAQVHAVAGLLDSLNEWAREASSYGNRINILDRVSVYIGDDNPIGRDSGMSFIIGSFASPYSDTSYIGVLGPTRQNYSQVINLIDHTSRKLEEVLNV
jgi:heat-inducible transcriptional repressor